jgi:AcrR family transcriptional regulator
MGPIQRGRRSSETRSALLDAAAHVFVERGFYGATVREIAGRAGFTNPVLYYHFGCKEELYDAVIRGGFERFRELVTDALDFDTDAITQLRAIATAYLRFGREDPIRLRALYAELFRPRRADPEFAFDEMRQWATAHIESALRAGIRSGDLAITDVARARRIFVALLGGLMIEQARDPHVVVLDAGLADTVVDVFLGGVPSLEEMQA